VVVWNDTQFPISIEKNQVGKKMDGFEWPFKKKHTDHSTYKKGNQKSRIDAVEAITNETLVTKFSRFQDNAAYEEAANNKKCIRSAGSGQ
jgi:plasmid replication initiation protein